MRRGFLALIGLLVAHCWSAQQITVTDLVSNAPIEGAVIFSEKRTTFLKSDSKGRADITELLPCDSILITHVAYESQAISTVLLKNDALTVTMMPTVIQMPTFELKAARESFFESPKQMVTLAGKAMETTQPRTTADLLERSGEVFVQRSQLGGGSPVLRGFEANRILLMVDGVRLNNAIYRSGHLQNAITVDPYLLERTEVIFGPGSLIYGSDALGGVIHFRSRRPKTYPYSRKQTSLRFAQKMSTATEESAGHFDFEYSGDRLASLTSFTLTRFGKLHMGENRLHGDPDWGLVPEYVERIGGQDSILQNPDPSVIPNSGYEQYDLAQKVLWQAADSTSVLFNVQYSTSSQVPRNDQLAEYRDGELRFAEWSYGPQERLLISTELDILSDNELFDKGDIIVAFQQIGEDRITRGLNDPMRFVRQEEVNVISLNGDFIKRIANKDLYFGFEATNNNVDSKAYVENIEDGTREDGPTRYPNGGSKISTMAAYASLNAKINGEFVYNLGLRYSHAYANSKFNPGPFYDLPFDFILFDNGALTGSASIIWKPDTSWDLGLSASTGFRSPNVDDYGKVFERAGIVMVPTDDLGPEYTWNGELRATKREEQGRYQMELAGFYTLIDNAIVQEPRTLNGMDSLVYEGQLAQIAMNVNAEQAEIYGASGSFTLQILKDWTWMTTATKTIGRVKGTGVPLAHIPPFFARTGVDRIGDKTGYGAYVLYNDTKTSGTIAPGRTDNADQGLDGAFPSWYSINAYVNFKLENGLRLTLFVDNLTDVHYKAFASGISAPGRNLGFSLTCDI